MKEINLPITQTFSMSVDLRKAKVAEGPNGEPIIPIGHIDFGEKSKVLEFARKNGGQILYAATSIEKQINSILLLYFMGPFIGPDDRRDIFENEVLGSNAMTFQFKKEMVKKLIEKENLLPGKHKNNLQTSMKKIQDWRNAFAHGTLQYDTMHKCIINFYSGKKTFLKLNEEFWNSVEKSFKETSEYLKRALSNLTKKYEDQLDNQADGKR